MKNLKYAIILLAAIPILMMSCNKKANDQTARVTFKLTDAPAQFDALNIDVRGVQVHRETGGWVSLQSSLGVINILNYVNGTATVMAEGVIPAGTINGIHLMLGSNNSVVLNGTSFALGGTTALQSGLNVALNNNLQAGGNYEWTIDFDAAQSVLANVTGSFDFHPTIRLIVDPLSINTAANSTGSGSVSGTIDVSGSGTGGISGGGNVSGGTSGSTTISATGTTAVGGNVTGNISGSINALAGLASVCVSGPNNISVCTMTDIAGNFTIQALASGSYTVQISPVLPLLSAHTVSNVNVTAGQTTKLGLIAL